ncbi:hypothetical protein G3I76_54475, partial [Streptomyces sp. SID11233]|nr:hypothetical protein [Streptomyces sp. SID11233]
DEVLDRPDAPPLIIDLHRCLAGGMYAMSTERQGALHSRLARVARTVGLPLELGGEATGDRLGPSVGAGVFLAAPASDFTRSDVLGSPAHYAKALNPASTSLLIEVPTFLVDPVACGARE